MTSRGLVFFLVGGLLAGCGTRGDFYEAALTPLPLVATSASLVQVVPQTRRAVVLTPGEATPGGLGLSEGARQASRIPGTELVAVLAGTVKAPLVDIVDVATGSVVTLATPGFFDTITWSDDGAFGVMTYATRRASFELVARNMNEVGLLDVGALTVTRLQLDTESLAPREVVFGPAEGGRRLVAVTLERGVALFDARHPEVATRRVSLRAPGATQESSVLKAVFSHDARWLYVRASNLDDVIVLSLGAEVGEPVGVSLNFVSGGRGLADIVVPPADVPDAVLAVYAASGEVRLLDAWGIQSEANSFEAGVGVRRAALLGEHRVLLWNPDSRTVTAWDMSDGRSGSVALDAPAGEPLVSPAIDRAVFPFAVGAVVSEVTVQPETNRLRLRLQSIQLSRSAGARTLDTDGRRLFFVAGGMYLVTMDLMTLSLSELQLDNVATGLHHLPKGDWLAVSHDGPLGDVTLGPAGASEPGQLLRYTNFALTDDLDARGDDR